MLEWEIKQLRIVIVGQYGVTRRNKFGDRLLEVCADQELVAGNRFFRKNYVHKYMWVRMVEGRVVDRVLVDYVLLPKRMRGRLLDVEVCKVKVKSSLAGSLPMENLLPQICGVNYQLLVAMLPK